MKYCLFLKIGKQAIFTEVNEFSLKYIEDFIDDFGTIKEHYEIKCLDEILKEKAKAECNCRIYDFTD